MDAPSVPPQAPGPIATDTYITPDALDAPRLVQRLQRVMDQRGWTQSDVAQRLDVSQPFVSALLREQKTPGRDLLLRILETFDIPWIDVQRHPDAERASEETRLVRIDSLTIEASAGDGNEVHFEETTGDVLVPVWYVRQRFGVEPARVKRIVVSGNSMTPTILPGERVWITLLRPGEEPLHGGVYVLRGPHGLLIKRVYYDADAVDESTVRYYVRIHSDNPEAGTDRLPLDVFRRDFTPLAQFRCAERDL